MIELKDVKKSYGSVQALNGLNMTVEDGATYGFIGPNGAGKTTAIRLMLGLIRPDSGEILLDNMEAGSNVRRLKKRIGYVQDSMGVYPGLLVSEYMNFFASCYDLSGIQVKRRIEMLLDQVGLSGREEARVDSLSRGMQQKLSIARALIHDPRILIMDEPTDGLDPSSRYEVKQLISDLSNEGKTIIVSSHILSELSELCSHIGILDHGKMLVEGRLTEVLQKVNASSPIILSLEGSISDAMRVLRKDKKVASLSIRNQDIWIRYNGDQQDEAGLLEDLVMEGIPVRGFHREKGNLESLFLQLTGQKGERTVVSFDAESDI